MSATVIPATEIARRRAERERQRREREALAGTILQDDDAGAPASEARDRETRR